MQCSHRDYIFYAPLQQTLPAGIHADMITNGFVPMGLGQNIVGYTKVHEEEDSIRA